MGRFATRIAWSRNIYLLGLLTPAVAAVMLILSIPVAWLVRISLFPQDQSYDLRGWSAVHYLKALTDDLYLESLARTTIYSLIVTLGTAILGFPLGYAAARGKLRRWKIFFIVLPLTLRIGHASAVKLAFNGTPIDLTLTEFKIVALLALRAGEDVSYREIYDVVHSKGFAAGYGSEGYRANVRTFIKRIRQKFHDVDPEFEPIHNDAGFGYRWVMAIASKPVG